MELKSFQLGLRTLTAAIPYGKKLQDDEIAFLFLTLPEKVREQVSDSMWAYAISKALQETNPDKEAPIHIRVLGHLYNRENGRANFKWGLRIDDELIACGDDPKKLEAYREKQHQRFLQECSPARTEERTLDAGAAGSTDNFLGF